MEEIQILEDLDHVKLRPAMYIGSTFSPDHLAYEIVDNALDELANEFASIITIDVPESGHIIVTDNGRGIPVHLVNVHNVPTDSIVASCTKLFSGAKFNSDTYKFSIGLHGVGLVAVNALSEFMSVTVRDRIHKHQFHHYYFLDSVLTEQEILENDDPNIIWSTRIEFKANPKYFSVSDINVTRIIDRMTLVSSKLAHASILVNGQLIPNISLHDYAKYQLKLPDEIPLFHITDKGLIDKNINIYFTFDPNGPVTPIILGDVNLHICGGTFQRNFQNFVSKTLLQQHPKLSKSESSGHLRAYVSIVTPNVEFDSNSKATMVKSISSDLDRCSTSLIIALGQSYIKDCIQTIIDRKTHKRVVKQITVSKRVTAKDGFKDRLNTSGGILYLMEGKSADGSLSQIRDKYTEAILPISGKILNVVNKSVEEAISSKRFKFLLEVLGVDLSQKNQKEFRYDTIKILCDADPDGLHISVLLVLGIWYYAPELIRQGKVYIILPPLYGVVKSGTFIPIYLEQDIAKYPGCDVTRFKGIGEMSPKQLEVVIRYNLREYVVTPPATPADQDNILRCITDVEVKRKLCKDKRFQLQNLFKFL